MEPLFHFIGIGGIGMSALAQILLDKGAKVSGSDLSKTYVTEALEKKGATISFGHREENVFSGSTVVYSTDIGQTNPELVVAKKNKLELLHRSEMLGRLMEGKNPLLVTGTHGKTTTSSLLAHTLVDAGLDPCYAVGGVVKSLQSNGGYGKGDYFVAEADESDGSFLKYPAFGAILTNIDRDHLNHWQTFEALLDGFSRFAQGVGSEEHLFWCADDEPLKALSLSGSSYGFSEGADLYIESFTQLGWKNRFDFTFEGKHYPQVEIPLVGAHNVLNASAVFGLALRLNLPEEKIRKAFLSFQGVNRRADFKGQSGGALIYDDYGHHPVEIFATLRAMNHAQPKRRLIVAFQPQRYTRTRDCFGEFGPAFNPADVLILTDIYSAGEPPIDGITTEALLKKVTATTEAEVHYVPRKELVSFLGTFLQPDDLLVTMGAGDITKVGPELVKTDGR